MFKTLEYCTSELPAVPVIRVVHGQCDAVDQDDEHADALEPRDYMLRKIKMR